MGVRSWCVALLALALWFFGILFAGKPSNEKLERCIYDADERDSTMTFNAQGQGGPFGGGTLVEVAPNTFRMTRPYRTICINQLAAKYESFATFSVYSSAFFFLLFVCIHIYFKWA